MTCCICGGGVGTCSVGWSGVSGLGAVLATSRSSQVLCGCLGAGGVLVMGRRMAVHT